MLNWQKISAYFESRQHIVFWMRIEWKKYINYVNQITNATWKMTAMLDHELPSDSPVWYAIVSRHFTNRDTWYCQWCCRIQEEFKHINDIKNVADEYNTPISHYSFSYFYWEECCFFYFKAGQHLLFGSVGNEKYITDIY